MDDSKLANEILSQLDELGITKVDGHFSYKGRREPLRIVYNFGIDDLIKNSAVQSQMIREEIIETMQAQDFEFDEEKLKLLETMLGLFFKFFEEDPEDSGSRH